MTISTNSTVTTPLGKGTVQGRTVIGWIVRVAVTDANRVALRVSWTPNAKTSAVWEFEESELK